MNPTIEKSEVQCALESAFREVMEMMFGLAIEGPQPADSTAGMAFSGLIGLAGEEFKGLLRVSANDSGSRLLAATLLGGEEMLGDDPSMITDSLGELTNMLGGSVKRLIDATGAKIELSLPSVLEGEGEVHAVGATGEVKLKWFVEGSEVQTSLIYTKKE